MGSVGRQRLAHENCYLLFVVYETGRQNQEFSSTACMDKDLRILLANPQGRKLCLACAVVERYRNLENPTQQSRLYRVEIGSPTVIHEPELSTAYENRRAIFRRVSLRFSPQFRQLTHGSLFSVGLLRDPLLDLTSAIFYKQAG